MSDQVTKIKETGTLAAGAAVGAAADDASEPLQPPPPPSPEIEGPIDKLVKTLVDRHAGETIVYTTDKGTTDCQADGCIMRVRVKDGVIKAIETDDTISLGSAREDPSVYDLKRGAIQQRTCPLARAWREHVYSPTRILYPMKNVGKRGEGKFVRITWTEALDTIAAKSREIKKKYGPYSIYSWPLASLFGCGVESWGAHSYSGFTFEQWLVAGNQADMDDPQTQSEVFKSKLVVMWGRNPVVNEGGTWPYYLVRAKEAGLPFISIDPRYTTSAEVLNAQWIPIRPGTDLAMALAVANVLFKEDLYDKEYVAKWAEPTGFAKFKDYVLGVEDGVEKAPEWAERLCGVPADTIRQFTRLCARSRPTMLLFGWAASRSMSTNVSRVIFYLQVLTGNLTLPGGGGPWWGGHYRNPSAGPIPSIDWKRKGRWKVEVLFNGPVKYPDAILLREKVDSGELTREQYNEAIGNKRDNTILPNIQIVQLQDSGFASSPIYHTHIGILHALDSNKRIKAIKKVEFTYGFARDTKNTEYRYMDIVLPRAEYLEENYGMQPTRRTLGLANFFVYCKPAIKPQGEARPPEWVWIQLAKRFGFDKDYNPLLADILGLDEWDADKWFAAFDRLWRDAYEAWAKREDVAFRKPPNWEEFSKKPVYRYDACTDLAPLSAAIAKGKNPIETSSGKVEIYSKFLEKPEKVCNTLLNMRNPVANYDRACVGRPGPAITPLPKWHDDIYGTFHDTGTKQYPLIVLSPNSIYRSHSLGFGNPWLNGDCYRHACWISVADAKARGIKDGDLVRVYSSVGEMIIPAYVTSRIIPGVVSVFHGAYYAPDNVRTALMPDGIDRGGAQNFLIEEKQPGKMIMGPTLDAGLCQVEKL